MAIKYLRVNHHPHCPHNYNHNHTHHHDHCHHHQGGDGTRVPRVGWAGTGTVPRRERQNRGGGKKDTFTIFVASSSLSWTNSFSPPRCERLITCATSPLAPSSQTRIVQHSGQKTESLITISLKLMFYHFHVLICSSLRPALSRMATALHELSLRLLA